MKICMEELDDTLNKIEHENLGSSIILFGDLNARTGSPQDVEEEDLLTFENSTLLPERTSMDGVINQRGRELTRLLETHGQHILNGRTPEDIPGCFTFIRGKAKSVIDYFCTNCFKELKRIEFYNPLATGHNWAAQLREELLNIGREDLYNSENPEEIKGEIESILTLHRQKTRQEDTRRISQSSYSDLYQHITTGLETEPYLTFDLRIERIRTVSHLRVASRKEIRIYTNRCSYVMNTEEICSICNRGEEEDLTHILLTCPMYAETRAGIKQYIIENHSNDTTVKNLLTFDTEEKLNRVFNYITTCMRTRSFIRFE
ncbi:hypothetical protein M8J76_009952 [Diaphorina citri]|nr:hypothetical protein M8J76_009952 [Diaphorina citri]